MQLWFWAVVGATVFAGVGNFIIKIAAKRGYEGGLFSLYGGISSTLVAVPIAIWVSGVATFPMFAFAIGMTAGFLGGMNNVLKVIALRYIDAAIYFPLFKLISPALAIVFGAVFFAENFSGREWFGLVLGLMVPLLLITPSERGRQVNLIGGLIIVLITALFAAGGAALAKYATVLWPDPWWVLVALGIGLIVGSLCAMLYTEKQKLFATTYWITIDRPFIVWAMVRGVLMSTAVWLVNYAYIHGGPLAIVHTIHSLYILIPVMLAVIVYNEHMNAQKAIAVVLSLVALELLG